MAHDLPVVPAAGLQQGHPADAFTIIARPAAVADNRELEAA